MQLSKFYPIRSYARATLYLVSCLWFFPLIAGAAEPVPKSTGQAAATTAPTLTVNTNSGDKLSGKFVDLTSERLAIETPYAGVINVRIAEIQSWQTADPTLRARVAGALPQLAPAAASNTTNVVPQAAPAKPPQLALTGTAVIKAPATAKAVKTVPADQLALKAPNKTGSKAASWQRTVNLAYALSRGNVNASDLNGTFAIARKRGTRRLALNSLGRYSVRNGAQVAHLVTANLRYELAQAKFPTFTETIFEIDRIKKLEYRLSKNVGVSYPALQREGQSLSFDFGTGLMKEAFSNGKENLTATSLLRAKAEQKIKGKAQLSQQVSLFSDLLKRENYRMQTDISLTMPITKFLGFRVAGLNRFDNNPIASHVKQNDFSLLTGFNINF